MRLKSARGYGWIASKLLAAVVVLGFAVPSNHASAAEFESGGFVGIGYGIFREYSDIQEDTTKNNYAYKLFFGYQFRDYFGVEGGFVDFDHLEHNLGGNVIDEVEIKSYYARAYGQLPISRNAKRLVALYAAGGVHRWDRTEEFKVDTFTVGTDRAHDVSGLYAAGLVLRTRDSSVRLEYEMFREISLFGTDEKIDLRLIQLNLLFHF